MPFGRKKTDAEAERETQVDQMIVRLLGLQVDAAVELQRDGNAPYESDHIFRLLLAQEPTQVRQRGGESIGSDPEIGKSHPVSLHLQINELESKRDAKKACLRLYRAGFVTIDPFDDVRLTPAGYEWYRAHRDELPNLVRLDGS